jgi:hypothetical protein
MGKRTRKDCQLRAHPRHHPARRAWSGALLGRPCAPIRTAAAV